nr:chorismate-binding protein [Pseudomonas sp.]
MPISSVHPLPYHADPGAYFARLRHAPGAVLLDSGRPGAERGRYDILSAWPLAVLAPGRDESANDFLARLRQGLHSLGPATLPAGYELPFVGGLLGYMAYDFGRRLESMTNPAIDDLGLADAHLGLYAWAVISDHQRGTSQLVCHPRLPATERERLLSLLQQPAPDTRPAFRLLARFNADTPRERYQQAIAAIQAYILAGDCYQVNFAQRFRAPCQGDPWTAYR